MKSTASFVENSATMNWAMEETSKDSEMLPSEYFDAWHQSRGVFYVTAKTQRIMFLIGKLAAAGHDGLLSVRRK